MNAESRKAVADNDLSEDEQRSRIRNSALGSLTRREHSRAELASKLQKRFDSLGLITETLDWLESLHYLDDVRFAEAFVRAGILKGRGPQRIRGELQQKGLDAELITQALETADVNWNEVAREVWQRKFSAPPKDPKSRAKQMRFLVYRGFSLDMAVRTLSGGNDEPD